MLDPTPGIGDLDDIEEFLPTLAGTMRLPRFPRNDKPALVG